MAFALAGLGLKIFGGIAKGVGKIVGNIKARKRAKADRKLIAASERKAKADALFGEQKGLPNINERTDEDDITKLAFGDDSDPESKEKVKEPNVYLEWLRDNWKWFVPSFIGGAIALFGLLKIVFKRKR